MRGLLLLLAAPVLLAQTTPEELVRTIGDRFVSGVTADFEAVYPFAEGRELFQRTLQMKTERAAGLAAVAEKSADRALVLLSAGPIGFNSGDETVLASEIADRYEASRQDGVWKLTRRIPIDDGNRIVAQRLAVEVIPNRGLDVVDRLQIEISSRHGFATRLNHRAQIKHVRIGGRTVKHYFGGGLLWFPIAAGSKAEVEISYSLNIEKGPGNANSARFTDHAGHVRNQYFWHPFFGFGNPNGEALFGVTARISRDYYLATSLPQIASVEGGVRVLSAQSIRPTAALTMAYDRDWQPREIKAGQVRLEIFATPEFEPPADQIASEFQKAHRTLSARFGSPSGGYFAVVQGRSREGSGWHNLANQAVFAGGNGGPLMDTGTRPRAPFYHEVSHAWTAGAAPADHFLTEGWATFAEGMFLQQAHGDAVARRFWSLESDIHFAVNDGKDFLLRDPRNAGVAYHKGSWIFRMLEQQMDSPKFDAAIAEFSRRSLRSPLTSGEFSAIFERAKPGLGAFLRPWIEESRAPNLAVRIDGSKITIEQRGVVFVLPLEIDVETASATVRRKVMLDGSSVTLDAGEAVRAVALDPDLKLLLRSGQRKAKASPRL